MVVERKEIFQRSEKKCSDSISDAETDATAVATGTANRRIAVRRNRIARAIPDPNRRAV